MTRVIKLSTVGHRQYGIPWKPPLFNSLRTHTAIWVFPWALTFSLRPSSSPPQEALDNLMLEGDNIVSAARRAIMRHDYSAVLTIFPILKHLKNSKSDFDSTLQVGAGTSRTYGTRPR